MIYGVGINDTKFRVVSCPKYKTWHSMLSRCYNPRKQAERPTYIDCTVSQEWHKFSAFKAWMDSQPWQGNHLDKDLLVIGNRVYSPSTCMFIPPKLNALLGSLSTRQSAWPLGVTKDSRTGKFRARAWTNSRKRNLGYFNYPELAELAYKKFKADHIRDIAQAYHGAVQDALLRLADHLLTNYDPRFNGELL